MPPKRVRQPRDRYLTSTRNYWSKTLGNWKAANIPQINAWTNKSPSGWTPTTTQATPPLQESQPSAHQKSQHPASSVPTVSLAAFTKLQADLKKITDKLRAHQQETKSEHQLQSKMIQTLQNAQNTIRAQHSQDNRARSEITRIKAHLKDSDEYNKKRFGQLDHCQNTIQKQEQIIGRNQRQQLELEAKTDHHIQQVTQAMESTNARINTVTTRTNSLEHYC